MLDNSYCLLIISECLLRLFLALIPHHCCLPIFQVLEDLRAIWDWILIEKLHIPRNERKTYSAVLVMPETFDNRGI